MVSTRCLPSLCLSRTEAEAKKSGRGRKVCISALPRLAHEAPGEKADEEGNARNSQADEEHLEKIPAEGDIFDYRFVESEEKDSAESVINQYSKNSK